MARHRTASGSIARVVFTSISETPVRSIGGMSGTYSSSVSKHSTICPTIPLAWPRFTGTTPTRLLSHPIGGFTQTSLTIQWPPSPIERVSRTSNNPSRLAEC